MCSDVGRMAAYLSNPVLDSSSFSEIRDLRPVLVGVGRGTEC